MPAASSPWLKALRIRTLYWIEPERRGILALDQVHVPRRLARVIKQDKFEVRVDSAYDAVITGCASSRAGRRTTWINRRIRELYAELFEMGYCHTVRLGSTVSSWAAFTGLRSAVRSSGKACFLTRPMRAR